MARSVCSHSFHCGLLPSSQLAIVEVTSGQSAAPPLCSPMRTYAAQGKPLPETPMASPEAAASAADFAAPFNNLENIKVAARAFSSDTILTRILTCGERPQTDGKSLGWAAAAEARSNAAERLNVSHRTAVILELPCCAESTTAGVGGSDG